MSRIGRQPIVIPAGVKVLIQGNLITVQGPKGELKQEIHRLITLTQKDNQLLLAVPAPGEKAQKALWGLAQRLISNMIKGVTQGFSQQLEINGVGYKAAVKGQSLVLEVGYSHSVEYKIPAALEIKVEKNIITISGINKQLVGQTAAEIRAVRKAEPYKGKGIKYLSEVVRRKVGKTAAKAA